MSAALIFNRKSTNLVSFCSRILTEQFETDVEIVSKSGSKHPCHKLFLTGNSPVFEAMFKGDSFKEGQMKSVTMDMSEKGVVAILNFLYCQNSGDVEAVYDFETCMELFEASEMYSMANLQESMKHVFMEQCSTWFQIGEALQLFCFVRNVGKCGMLKRKCCQVLKLNHTEMMNSEDYKRLFKENPEAAMDLCNILSK